MSCKNTSVTFMLPVILQDGVRVAIVSFRHFLCEDSWSLMKWYILWHLFSVGITLLDCKWRDGRHLCFVKTGLSFDRNFSKSITIAIPASWTVDSANVIYTCHIVSPGLYESVPCKFTPDQGNIQHPTKQLNFAFKLMSIYLSLSLSLYIYMSFP